MWGRLGLQCLKTVKSEVIAMWVEWAKEMQVEKKKNLAPGMVLVICLFLMPGPSSLPLFPAGSFPSPLDYCLFAEHSAPSGPSNLTRSLFFWRPSSFLVFQRRLCTFAVPFPRAEGCSVVTRASTLWTNAWESPNTVQPIPHSMFTLLEAATPPHCLNIQSDKL